MTVGDDVDADAAGGRLHGIFSSGRRDELLLMRKGRCAMKFLFGGLRTGNSFSVWPILSHGSNIVIIKADEH